MSFLASYVSEGSKCVDSGSFINRNDQIVVSVKLVPVEFSISSDWLTAKFGYREKRHFPVVPELAATSLSFFKILRRSIAKASHRASLPDDKSNHETSRRVE